MAGVSDITLQINLCAGDIAYAEKTVPALVAAHPRVAARLAVVDCCRPQRTRIFDPNQRLPEPEFGRRVKAMRELAVRFQREGLFDRVEFLTPGATAFEHLARRYVQPWMTETHDYGGCAFMGYWAALDFPNTRYVLHYDADMLLHQSAGFDWTDAATNALEQLPHAIAASPRISPPGFAATEAADAPSQHEGRPLEPVAAGWLNDWFSTRCFLLDRGRLEPELPLVRGTSAWTQWLRRLIDRGYPPGPEQLLFRHLGSRGLRCLHLRNENAWLLHPRHKSADFVSALPAILAAVAAGAVPAEQRGYADLRLEAWRPPGAPRQTVLPDSPP